MANINTAGFKPHLAMLQSRPSQPIAEGETMAGTGTVDDLSGGIMVQPTETHYLQGPLKQTGRQTDFAINDDQSFFTVRKGEQEFLTRAGNFQFDANGRLVTPEGYEVQGAGGGAIRIDPNVAYNVTADGAIQQGAARQMLRVVQPQSLGDLTRVGENLFQPLAAVQDVNPQQRQVVAGTLEMSGVEPTGAMMQLIEATRLYEANVRMIQTRDDAMGQLISRLLRQN